MWNKVDWTSNLTYKISVCYCNTCTPLIFSRPLRRRQKFFANRSDFLSDLQNFKGSKTAAWCNHIPRSASMSSSFISIHLWILQPLRRHISNTQASDLINIYTVLQIHWPALIPCLTPQPLFNTPFCKTRHIPYTATKIMVKLSNDGAKTLNPSSIRPELFQSNKAAKSS